MFIALQLSPRFHIYGNRVAIVFAVAVGLVAVMNETVSGQVMDGRKSWQGTWNNRKYKTSGPLKCTAFPKDEKTWEARFEGRGLGKPFRYDVTMDAMQKGDRALWRSHKGTPYTASCGNCSRICTPVRIRSTPSFVTVDQIASTAETLIEMCLVTIR